MLQQPLCTYVMTSSTAAAAAVAGNAALCHACYTYAALHLSKRAPGRCHCCDNYTT
jgi:hypothetical protein